MIAAEWCLQNVDYVWLFPFPCTTKRIPIILVDKGLIEEIPSQFMNAGSTKKFVYKITGKGLRFLQIFQEIEKIVGLD